MQPYLILAGMIALGYVTRNTTVSLASALLLALKIILPEDKLVYFGGHGLGWGVIILTAAVLTPMALGKIGPKEVIEVFKSPEGFLSVGPDGCGSSNCRFQHCRDDHRRCLPEGCGRRPYDCQRYCVYVSEDFSFSVALKDCAKGPAVMQAFYF